jgi:amino acid adenylation domain-containing protein
VSPAVLQEWVARAAEVRPDARALVHPDAVLTYGALERASNRLARALREAGCERGDRVAFLLPRSPMTIAVIVGILKADCIYVPLDLRSPGARLATVVRQCEPSVILANPATRDRLQALVRAGGMEKAPPLGWLGREKPSRPIAADNAKELEAMARVLGNPVFTLGYVETLPAEPPAWKGGSDDAAYMLFTSGSTGTPKGVVITHRNVIAFIEWAVRTFGLGPLDRLGGYTELTFDLSTFDIHATFAAGAELHMVPEDLKLLPPKVVEFMRESELTHWLSVPSFMEYVVRFDSLEPGDLPTMRWVTWCGDVLPTPALSYWMKRLPHASFANLYGPTETTVASSYYRVPRTLPDPVAPVPIGRACDGEELLILDDELRPVPTGDVGHLYIRGVGLSPGYWRDPERTGEVFLPDPDPFRSDPDARIYRTGDLARMDADGNVHFLGREDQQIKTRGFRVELGEVEAALLTLPEIEGCAVVGFTAKESPGKLMGCAYVSANGKPVPGRHLKERLQDRLPDYMIPVRWKVVDRLPLSDRGKVHRRKIQEWMEEEG